jgi:very-short-patch-repair endonuclease
MEFNKNLEDLSTRFNTRKDHVKAYLLKHFKQGKDYTISKTNIKYPLDDEPSKIRGGAGRNKENILLNHQTFELIKNSYNLKNRYITKIDNNNIQNPFLTNIESNTIGFIQTILKNIIECKRQFKVGKYYIDLYIPSKKLAIECDEYNHSNSVYNNAKEIERENYIKEKLDCDFIRFDPCSKEFIFEEFVNTILKLLLK